MIAEIALASFLAPLQHQNFVVIFADDLGYGDLSCYGNTKFRTPNLDRMARNGVRFTDFNVASPACSPSRAAILTGCYPARVSVPQVLNPDSPTGLNLEEMTIAQMLKPLGYATACIGKWHLGVKNLMPTFHGFDSYYGLPYSNDMWPPNGKGWPDLYLHEGTKPVEQVKTMEDQALLTHKYTQKAKEFIAQNKRKPFFLYMTPSMPHVPIAASKKFNGKSGKGLYADTIQELDASVGEILDTLKKNGLEKNTLVMFSSDNGPWLPYGEHAGSSGGLREGKGTAFEGGFRVPGIFYQPGTIPANRVIRELASTMDVLPTIASMSGAKLPEREIDGHNIINLITDKPGARTPWRWFYYYWPGELHAVRSGKWKLHVPHNHRLQTQPAGVAGKSSGEMAGKIGLSLFDLEADPFETKNLVDEYPEVVARMLRMIEVGRSDFGDTLTKAKGSLVRPPGKVDL
ncbi:MAG: sulfatase [Armatimonadota bacterium]